MKPFYLPREIISYEKRYGKVKKNNVKVKLSICSKIHAFLSKFRF